MGLLDSGANVSIIGGEGDKYIKKWGVEQIKINKSIKTADGTPHLVSKMIRVPVNYHGKTKQIDILVVPSMSKKIILGTNFWQAFKIRPVVGEILLNEEESCVADPILMHELTTEQRERLKALMIEFKFAKEGEIGFTNLIEHEIDTGDAKPIKQKQHYQSPYIQEKIIKEIDRLLALKIIERASAPTWLSPIIAVPKSDGGVRLCLDARKVNDHTVKNAYPQHNANRILSQLRGTKYLTTLDLSDAYYQVKLKENSRNHTAFSVSSKGTYRYIRMANGLINASSTLCELLDIVMGCDLEPNCFFYMDDLVICTDTFDEHVRILKEIARRLREAGLSISKKKSHFCRKQTKFLGYLISTEGIHADPARVDPIIKLAQPRNIRAVRSLIGAANWYRRFIPNFSDLVAPITELLKKSNTPFKWTDRAENAFGNLKTFLTSPPILHSPDFTKPFTITADASDIGCGSFLSQNIDGMDVIISYFSAKFTDAQRKYTVTERECLGCLLSMKHFRGYIEGVKFYLQTDHRSLLWLQNLKDPTGRLARWALQMQAYDVEISHKPGKSIPVPDCLSRAFVEVINVNSFIESNDPEYINIKTKIESGNVSKDRYKIKDGIAFKNISGKTAPIWRMIVPSELQNEVLRESHDDILACHGGFYKTAYRIKSQYTWENMDNSIKTYIGNCDVCKAVKNTNRNQRAPMGAFREALQPWRVVSTDYIGPLPRTKSGNKWILSIVDSFSKYVIIKPMKQSTAPTTCDLIEKNLFLVHGVPEKMISDNGSQFESHTFAKLLQKYRVNHYLTPYYHAQSNPCEAANKIIGNGIKSYVEENDHSNWDRNLVHIACAINNSAHFSTKNTPYEILYGNRMKLAGDRHQIETDNNPNEMPDIALIRKRVNTALKAAYEKARSRYDLRTRMIKYAVGDLVWKRNTKLSNRQNKISHKLMPRYVKCRIAKILGSNTYALTNLDGKSIGNFHTKDLKADNGAKPM